MPNASQEAILAAYVQAVGSSASDTSTPGKITSLVPPDETELTNALTSATQVINAQTQATTANTDALGRDAQTRSGGGVASDLSGALNTASQLLGGGLSFMPLISLFSGLFGGGQSEQPAPLVQYAAPPSLNLESTSNYQSVTWGENGLPRGPGPASTGAAQQINVQVQAMDSRSFLDHSDEIAQAVRQAMLNMNALNDVVTSL